MEPSYFTPTPTAPTPVTLQAKGKEALLQIIGNLLPPPNYRVTLSVDKGTEKLVLRILKRDAWEFKILGYTIWRHIQEWDGHGTEQRRIEGRTYDALLRQITETPEFLEFEQIVEGRLSFRTATDI